MKDYHLNDNILQHTRTETVQLNVNSTVGQALEQVREMQPQGRIVYFYVVDDDQRLLGVMPTRRLLMSKPETPVRDLMIAKPVVVPDTATLLDACDLFVFHRLLALPVVDAMGRLVGVVDVEVYTDEITDLAHKEESDDFFQLIGVRLSEVRTAALPVVFRNRFPWLLCNVGGGLLAAVIAGLFQNVIDKVVVLSLFIPVVLALAESVSIQSLSLNLQAHHGARKLSGREVLLAVWRELPVGLLLGLGCALLVSLVAWLWKGDVVFAGVLLASILLSVTAATVLGLLVPAALRWARTDPQIASGPVTLTLTDAVTLLIYLGIATRILG